MRAQLRMQLHKLLKRVSSLDVPRLHTRVLPSHAREHLLYTNMRMHMHVLMLVNGLLLHMNMRMHMHMHAACV